jgi:FtsH-binding integral membrane protein
MDTAINLALVISYLYATIICRENKYLSLSGLIAVLATCVVSAWLEASQHAIEAAYGFEGYVYRWNSAMATISLLWFISIQKTNVLSILIPCATIFLIDAVLVVLSGFDHSGINNYIVLLTVACHLTYCIGCANGGNSYSASDNRNHQSFKKISRGHKE